MSTIKHGGGSIMVRGSFAGRKTRDLVKIDGRMVKETYREILEYHAIPSGRRLVDQRFIFQEDNDPKHASKL